MEIRHLSSFRVTGNDIDIEHLQKYIFSALGDELFTYTTRKQFVYKSLTQIEPYHTELAHSKNAISEACVSVMKYFKLRHWLNDTKADRIEQFYSLFLELEVLPIHKLTDLQREVHQDLKALHELMQQYERDPYIKKYIEDDEIPRNHSDRTKKDFYKRCIQAQKEIVDYLSTGIKKRAIEKATFTPAFFKELNVYGSEMRDRPYSFRAPFGSEPSYYDYKKIDLIGHRLFELENLDLSEWQDLYTKDKSLFYNELSKYTSPEELFDIWAFYLAILPFTNDRKAIFKELRSLYKNKLWIGLYALSLSQVEGIFTEMSNLISKKSSGSLPDKVNQVRPLYKASNNYFDYYQFYLPTQRNKFMHAGHDEDFEVKSLDMLYDIHHLLTAFHEFDNPVVMLTKIHKIKNQEFFYTLSGFNDYFNLLNQLSTEQRSSMIKDITYFEKEILVDTSLAESICADIISQTPVLTDLFRESVRESMQVYKTHFDFEKSSIKDLGTLIENGANRNVMEDSIWRHEGEILLAYYQFLENFKKHLPSLSVEVIGKLNECKTKFGRLLKHISAANDCLLRIYGSDI